MFIKKRNTFDMVVWKQYVKNSTGNVGHMTIDILYLLQPMSTFNHLIPVPLMTPRVCRPTKASTIAYRYRRANGQLPWVSHVEFSCSIYLTLIPGCYLIENMEWKVEGRGNISNIRRGFDPHSIHGFLYMRKSNLFDILCLLELLRPTRD